MRALLTFHINAHVCLNSTTYFPGKPTLVQIHGLTCSWSFFILSSSNCLLTSSRVWVISSSTLFLQQCNKIKKEKSYSHTIFQLSHILITCNWSPFINHMIVFCHNDQKPKPAVCIITNVIICLYANVDKICQCSKKFCYSSVRDKWDDMTWVSSISNSRTWHLSWIGIAWPYFIYFIKCHSNL